MMLLGSYYATCLIEYVQKTDLRLKYFVRLYESSALEAHDVDIQIGKALLGSHQTDSLIIIYIYIYI